MAAKKKTPKGAKRVQIKVKLSLTRIIVGLLIVFFLFPAVLSLLEFKDLNQKLDISTALNDIKDGKTKEVDIQGDKIILIYPDQTIKTTTKEGSISFAELLDRAKIDSKSVNLKVIDQSTSKVIGDILMTVVPIVIMAGFFLFIIKSQTRGASDLFSFGRSKAKLFAKGKQDITFADVAGVDDAKKELEEVVDFLKHPDKYKKIGARTPKGVLLFGPAGVGKCVVGDTFVWTNKGLMEIQDIPRYFYVGENGLVCGAQVDSFSPENLVSKTSPASHWHDLGESETYRIETQLGHEIEGTPEHPLVVMGEDGNLKFKKTEDIQIGDWLPLKTGSQMFGNYQRLDKEQAYILGLLTGDGGMTIKDRICFTTADKQLLTTFRKYIGKKYNDYQLQKTKSRKYDYVVTSASIKSNLLQSGLSENYSRNKKVPEQIMMSPKTQVVAFLQGLFDTDGSVYKTGKVEYATSSKKLAKQVSALLLNLGVMHKFVVKGNNQYADSYRILISGTALLDFNQQVGFRLSRKQDKLNNYMSKVVLRTNVDLVPTQGARIKRLWRYLVENDKKPSLCVNESFHKQICRYAQGGRKPSVESLRLFLQGCVQSDREIGKNDDFKYLQLLVDSGLFFDQVVKKEGYKSRVYDFTIPNTHSFVSNGFVSHNTLLAKAVAGEAGVPFFSMAGSEFMEMLVGVGASRVRDLFQNAKAANPSIIFIDEIDAIGRHRGRSGFVGGHDEREQTLNQILVEMDGFTPNDNVIVLAATNRGDLLDPALLRPGRFDRRVTLDMPDKEGRVAILKIHSKGKLFASKIDWDRIADRTASFSGADLENMLNEAAISAARAGKTSIEMDDIEDAATKVKLGPAKRKIQTDEDKQITAYHEAGHAIVSHFLLKTDPVQRISIVARGMSLGHTEITPIADRTHETKSRLLESIATMLGGRAAEEVVFDELTAGASNDIKNATRYAKAMVVDFGMSDLGPVNLGATADYGEFGSMDWYEAPSNSPATAQKIDEEVKKIIDMAHKEATALIKKHKSLLDKVVKALLVKETLDRDEFEKIVGKKG